MKHFLKNHLIDLDHSSSDLFIKVWRRDGTKMTTEGFVNEMFQKHNVHLPIEQEMKLFYSQYKDAILKAEALKGSNELLNYLQQVNIPTALATGSKRHQLEAILKQNGWEKSFKVLVGEEDCEHFKPHPDPYLKAAQKLNIDPENCLVIEDSRNGVLSAKAAGMTVIAVTAGSSYQQDLKEADLVVDSLFDVMEILKKN
jgi:HAD superfamily hydrolase (TIGR01509 family)